MGRGSLVGRGRGLAGRLFLGGNALGLLVDVEDLLRGVLVELGDALADWCAESLLVVLGEAGRDAVLLVRLAGLAVESVGLLLELGGDSLVLADEALTGALVKGGEEVEEAGGDALLLWGLAEPGKVGEGIG